MAEATCPFCGIHHSEYMISLHIDKYHMEEEATSREPSNDANSYFSPKSSPPAKHHHQTRQESDTGDQWTKCTRQGCGEYMMLSEIDDHLALHEAYYISSTETYETTNRDEASPSRSKSQSSSSSKQSSRPGSRTINLLKYLSGTSAPSSPSSHAPPRTKKLRQPREPGRLGKRELGPHAFEKTMPPDVRQHLLNDARPRPVTRVGPSGQLVHSAVIPNETANLIPVLADLCAHEPSTAVTYLCDPSVRHIEKIRCDGNFCGYWNIQVLLSYLRCHHPVVWHGGNYMPDVLRIQDVIEEAWENGVCIYGKVETGGVRGSRKWIGTHEALAYFTQIGVEVEALSFREDEGEGGSGLLSAVALLDHIEAYFIGGLESAQRHGSSHITALPPVYLQRFGHSMSIVGLERERDGRRNLLVFDSSFPTSNPMERLLDGRRRQVATSAILKAYRRSGESLARWEEFEIIVPKQHASDELMTQQQQSRYVA